MGVSFKVSEKGTRYKPRVAVTDDNGAENGGGNDSSDLGKLSSSRDDVSKHLEEFNRSSFHQVAKDVEVSFSINLFPLGFLVGKATQLFNDMPPKLHPYDRASKEFFTAIENGWLPGDIFHQIPCKYVNGTVLCEIRDYRSCLPQMSGTGSTAISPVVHKVVLHMCLENIVKDISSMFDDSWSYEALLEVESLVLKTLHPDLHLDPKPYVLESDGEYPSDKLNLGISWGWKKRKQFDVPEKELDSAYNSTGNGDNHVGDSQSTLAYRVGEFTSSNQSVPEIPEKMLQHNSQLMDMRNRSVMADSSSPNTNNYCDKKESASLVCFERNGLEKQEIQGRILKKPKQEPEDFLHQHVIPTVQAAVTPTVELPCKRNPLHQQTEAEKVKHGSFADFRRTLPLTNKFQKESFQGKTKLPPGMSTPVLKQEPIETTSSTYLDAMKLKCNPFVMEMRSKEPNFLKKQQLLQSLLSRDKNVLTSTESNLSPHGPHHLEGSKSKRKEFDSKKRRAWLYPQTAAGDGAACLNSIQSEPLQREAFMPAKQKRSVRANAFGVNIVDSFAGTRNASVTNTNRFSLVNHRGYLASNAEQNPYPERFLKIKQATKRCKLSSMKCKLDPMLRSKPSFATSPLLVFHLANSEDTVLKDVTSGEVALSQCFVDRRFHDSKTRTLTFLRKSYEHNGNEISGDECQIKLVLSEVHNEGRVEASIIHGREKNKSICFPLSSTHFADQFASQFRSLMVHEGYNMVDDHVEATAANVDCGSSSENAAFVVGGTSIDGTFEPSSAPVISGPSPSVFSLLRDTMATDTRELSSQNILFGSLSLPTVNLLSPLQFMPRNSSQLKLEIVGQGSDQLQWPQTLNERAHLQFQMIQNQRLQEQVLQNMMVGEGLDAGNGLGINQQLGGGLQGLVYYGLGSEHNFTSFKGLMNEPGRGRMPWIGNLNQFKALGSSISSLDQRTWSLGMVYDNWTHLWDNFRTAADIGSAAVSGTPAHRNAGQVQIHRPTIPDMAYLLSNQQVPQPIIQRELQMLSPQPQMQQQMRYHLVPRKSSTLNEHVGSSLCQASPCQPRHMSHCN